MWQVTAVPESRELKFKQDLTRTIENELKMKGDALAGDSTARHCREFSWQATAASRQVQSSGRPRMLSRERLQSGWRERRPLHRMQAEPSSHAKMNAKR
jgi:hypothetical protein